MVTRDEGRIVLWPLYFDKSLTREQGRRVPLKLAKEKPTAEAIVEAARKLSLHPRLEKEAAHPASPWRRDGRVTVERTEPKATLLRRLAQALP